MIKPLDKLKKTVLLDPDQPHFEQKDWWLAVTKWNFFHQVS